MPQDLRENLNILIAAYEAQKDKADKLEGELATCQDRYDAARKKIKELEEKLDSNSLKTAFFSPGENAMAQKKIDRLIKEIDAALALLQ